MIEKEFSPLSINKQCHLLGIHRNGFYYKPSAESEETLKLIIEIDKFYLKYPFIVSRRVLDELSKLRINVGRKKVQRLRRLMNLETFYPKPNTSKSEPTCYKYPYLLKNITIKQINQVWAVDINYIPMKTGFMYCVAIIDLHSRFVLNWSLSNTMDAEWVVKCFKEAFVKYGIPEIINSYQGSKFTSEI